MVYILVPHYLTNNPKNFKTNKKDKQIYEKMHMANWWWIMQQVFIDSNAQNATIISVLLVTHKMVFIKYVRNIAE